MPRKSRTAAPSTPVGKKSVEIIYNTAIYARLSIEDNRDKESDSLDTKFI